MDKLVTSAITQSHTYQLQPAGPFERCSSLKKSLHAGKALVFISSSCNSSMTCLQSFSTPEIPSAQVMHLYYEKAFLANFIDVSHAA
jgi:hypothetical protein